MNKICQFKNQIEHEECDFKYNGRDYYATYIAYRYEKEYCYQVTITQCTTDDDGFIHDNAVVYDKEFSSRFKATEVFDQICDDPETFMSINMKASILNSRMMSKKIKPRVVESFKVAPSGKKKLMAGRFKDMYNAMDRYSYI